MTTSILPQSLSLTGTTRSDLANVYIFYNECIYTHYYTMYIHFLYIINVVGNSMVIVGRVWRS